jgi:FkbM family methyltransferase
VIAFRILGPEKVRLPLNNKEFWKQRDVLRGLFRQGDAIVSGKYSLGLMDLNWIGYPIKLYTTAIGPQSVFLLKQYEYHSSVARIKAEMGDVVIDGGGCWGDTGLYFAHEVGDDGKVVSLEGIPENLSVMRKNLGLNGRLRQRIEVVELPLWSTPGVRLHFHNDGPSSRGSLDPGSSAGETMVRESTSIDALFDRLDLRRIDFIKMDIEGAELEALHGARETIIRFRPKLAISVYHSISDFVDVFEFLSALNLGYKYYLGHYTIHWHETVLFAVSGETA